MKRKAVLISVLALLLMLMAVAPTMGATPKKIPVTFTRLEPFIVKGDSWYTEGDTYHIRDWVIGYKNYAVTGDGISLIGSTNSIALGNLNLKNQGGSMVYDSQLLFPDGTFEGTINVRGTFIIVPAPPPAQGLMLAYDAVFNAKWHGTGDYQGWTLTLDYETAATVVPSPLMGYLLIP